jgi:hypothetical protein
MAGKSKAFDQAQISNSRNLCFGLWMDEKRQTVLSKKIQA